MYRIKLLFKAISLIWLALLVGCSSDHPLMPTPNVYAGPGKYPADEIPESLRSNQVELLYVTDRERETDQNGETFYGAVRSNSSDSSSRGISSMAKSPVDRSTAYRCQFSSPSLSWM